MAKYKGPIYQYAQSMMPGYSGLTPTQLLTWIMIWSWSKQDKPCFMSNARFAKELAVSERQIKNVLKQLKDLGLVKFSYESINGSSKKRCLCAVQKQANKVGSALPHAGIESPPSGQEITPPVGTSVPVSGEVSFTHNRIDTISTNTLSIKEEEGNENEVMLLFSQLGKNAGVSMTTVKNWYQSFSDGHLKDGVWVDTDGKPLSKVQAYATKNFEYRLAKTKQNSYHRPTKKPNLVDVEGKIRYHRRRAENWSKNPEKQHLVGDELRYVKYLEHQLKDIS
jgi:hypothetical protein